MNDKDKEAFIKYICSHDQGILQHSDDTDIDVAERAWQAACEYMQEEYSNIMEAMTRTSQYNSKLQAELLEYKEAASSEAELVNELQAENTKLKQKISEIWKEAEKFYLDD